MRTVKVASFWPARLRAGARARARRRGTSCALCAWLRMVVWFSAWAMLLGLWLVLVGSLDPAEDLGALIGATIGAIGFFLVLRRDEAVVAVRPEWLLLLARRVPRQVVKDCFHVLGTLLLVARRQPVEGHVRRVPFDPGRADDPFAAGRRALVIFGVSLAPNAVAVRIEDHALLLHQLVDDRLPEDPEWPV